MNGLLGHLQLLGLLGSPPALFKRLFALPWYRAMLEHWVEPQLRPAARILELGCASGDFAHVLAQGDHEVWAVDRSARMLSRAQRTGSPVRFVQADATWLPFPDEAFDLSLAASLLNVVRAPGDLIAEMRRVCRPGGTVSVLVPDARFGAADALQLVTDRQLRGFSAAAFTAWHRLARKMEEEALCDHFRAHQLTDITSRALLGGMVLAVSGRREPAATRRT